LKDINSLKHFKRVLKTFYYKEIVSRLKMPFECIYCNKDFTSKSILKTHQKSAKYCLKIQAESSIKKVDLEIDKRSYLCKFCNKSFTSKVCFQKHLDICIVKLKNTIKELSVELDRKEKIIEEQKHQMKTIRLEVENEFYKQREERSTNVVEEIAKQPRVQQTNNNQKILITSNMDLSNEKMKEMIENSFNANYMIQGQKGVARFAYDTILKDEQGKLKYICTDPSRQIFQYKNEEGEIQKDVKAKKLTKALLDGELKSASHKIASDKMADNADDFLEYSTYFLDIKELEDDNSDFSKELSTLVI
jgi:hypothetical protein